MRPFADVKTSSTDWPANGLELVPLCPVCEFSDRTLLYGGLTDRVFFCAPGCWSLYQCKQCGCAYLDPRPTPSTVHLAYEKYYTHEAEGGASIASLGPFRRIQRVLANGYRNWRYGTRYRPASDWGVIAAWLIPGMRGKLDRQFRDLPRRSMGRVLDVGFGAGTFLEVARDAGWEAVGVDPDPVSVESARARGFEVRQGGAEAFADKPASFDVITLSHVIEHVHDPVAVMKQVYGLLKPGGMVWLETPNIDSFGHQAFRHNWLHLDPPRHLVIFNWESIAEILKRAGFYRITKRVGYFDYLDSFGPSTALSLEKAFDSHRPSFSSYLALFRYAIAVHMDYRRSDSITLLGVKP